MPNHLGFINWNWSIQMKAQPIEIIALCSLNRGKTELFSRFDCGFFVLQGTWSNYTYVCNLSCEKEMELYYEVYICRTIVMMWTVRWAMHTGYPFNAASINCIPESLNKQKSHTFTILWSMEHYVKFTCTTIEWGYSRACNVHLIYIHLNPIAAHAHRTYTDVCSVHCAQRVHKCHTMQ